ncbi:hypothetical protein FHX37_1119 [Haloactinospora alba]|uniref:ARB-07466-like C-terminal domain-containing protein n=1 Tax=Haloactinospora alba TaxID=405555 RepID=A0A543NHC3_9ACTN|nr:hypothetical protein FHX37_1119 [Haloactinospora alba]
MEPCRSTGADDFADFWAPDPPCPRPGSRTRHGHRGAAAAVTTAALLGALLPVPASAVPGGPVAPQEPTESLDSLRERSDRLSDEYNGELRDMEDVLQDAEDAKERADQTREKVEEAREQVEQLAVASYTNGGIDPAMVLFVDNSPQETIDRASLIGHLSSSNQDKIEQLQQAVSRNEKAQENADEKVQQAEDDLDELEEQREEVQGLIADYPEQEMEPPDNLTPRTRQMREIIIEKFGENEEHGGVGCYRPDGGYVVGEHPKGRACDFMVDDNGRMPSQEQIDHGYEIAEWAQENAERLGIMYIIYRQKIWDIRRGDEGWRDMSDRGSITENHFDHVHISMF